mgnify:CR=1 FL=1
MDPTLLLLAALAGMIYILAPGPAFLALLGIGAARGRPAGARFVVGNLLGDTLWAALALTAIIGAHSIDRRLFDLLGVACGLYLGWLGWRAVTVRRHGGDPGGALAERPFRRGLLFGLTNPKGYAVALAMFTALLAGRENLLGWSSLPLLLLATFAGFLLADAILLWLVGLPAVRSLWRRYDVWIVRVTGVLFLGFAFQALLHGVQGLMPRRS